MTAALRLRLLAVALAGIVLALSFPRMHWDAVAWIAVAPRSQRRIGEIALTGRWRATSWLAADVAAITRSYSAVVGRQRWILVRSGGEIRVPLAWGESQGILRLGYLPLVRVPGLDAPRLAFAAAAGMEYGLGRARLRGLYELERYDFPPAGAARRLEQLSTLSVSVSLRLRRAG